MVDVRGGKCQVFGVGVWCSLGGCFGGLLGLWFDRLVGWFGLD